MIKILFFVILVVSIVSLFALYSKRKKLNKRKIESESFDYSEEIFLPEVKKIDSEDINQFIQTNQGGFQIKGNTEQFIIKKNNRYEFLVKNGHIVACRDTDLHNEFIYYKKVN